MDDEADQGVDTDPLDGRKSSPSRLLTPTPTGWPRRLTPTVRVADPARLISHMGSVEAVTASVLVCGAVFDGRAEDLAGPTQILVRDGLIAEIAPAVHRPEGAEVIDLSDRTVSPGFIDTHVHLTMDASDLARQTLESSAAKALKLAPSLVGRTSPAG